MTDAHAPSQARTFQSVIFVSITPKDSQVAESSSGKPKSFKSFFGLDKTRKTDSRLSKTSLGSFVLRMSHGVTAGGTGLDNLITAQSPLTQRFPIRFNRHSYWAYQYAYDIRFAVEESSRNHIERSPESAATPQFWEAIVRSALEGQKSRSGERRPKPPPSAQIHLNFLDETEYAKVEERGGRSLEIDPYLFPASFKPLLAHEEIATGNDVGHSAESPTPRSVSPLSDTPGHEYLVGDEEATFNLQLSDDEAIAPRRGQDT